MLPYLQTWRLRNQNRTRAVVQHISPSLSLTSHSRPTKLCRFLTSSRTFPLFLEWCPICLQHRPFHSRSLNVPISLGITNSFSVFKTWVSYKILEGLLWESFLDALNFPSLEWGLLFPASSPPCVCFGSPLICLEGRDCCHSSVCDHMASPRTWHTVGLQWVSRKRKTPR